MKKIVAIVLTLILAFCIASVASADDTVEYYKKLVSGGTWTEKDHSVIYQKNALNYLPDCINGSKTTLSSSQCTVFGDESGEVWVIINSDMYRMWFTPNGDLVLTSTSEGFGWTGYAVFSPSNK